MTPSTPPRRWSLVAFPGDGKSSFAAQMKKPILPIDVDARFSEVFALAGGEAELGALAVGLPQLILPQGADQFHNARALTAIGAARALLNDEQSPGSIRDGVSALLTDDRQRAVTIRLCDEIAALPAPADVVAELVELVDR